MDRGLSIGSIRMNNQTTEKVELIDVPSENGSSKLDLLDTF